MTRPTRFTYSYPQGVGIPGGDPTLPEGQAPIDCCDDEAEMPDRALDQSVFIGVQESGLYAEIIADAPDWYYQLDEPSGAFMDSSGHGVATTETGTITRGVAGPIPGEDGITADTGEFLTLGYTATSLSAATIEGWYRWSGSSAVIIEQNRYGSGVGVCLQIAIGATAFGASDGQITAFFNSTSYWLGIHTTGTYNDGNWHHVVATWSGGGNITTGQLAIYVDGASVATTSDSNTGGPKSAPVSGDGYMSLFNSDSGGAGGAHGTVDADEMAFYPTALSAARVLAHYDATGGATVWQGAGPNITDGDDATCEEVVGPDIVRVWLGDAFAIARVRLYLGTETSGARSYTLIGANEADFSDAVTVATIDFTALGSFTDQEVTESWTPSGSYEFWQLSGDDETRNLCSFELYEAGSESAAAVQAALEDHIDDPVDAHDAAAVSADTTGFAHSSGDDVQEVLADFDAAIGSGSGTGDVYTVEPQNVQSRQYLMRDGTWRDPFITGDGNLTAGTIATITDDTKYNAWPNVVRLLDGRLIMAYVKGDSHNEDNTGNVVGKIGTVAYDGSVTWGTEFTIANETLGAINVGLGVTDTGRVIAAYNLYDFPASPRTPVDAVRVRYSDDDGTTWSSAYTVNTAFTSSCANGTSHLIQRRDGTVMLAVYGLNSGDTFWSASCFFSTDDGETWGDEVLIADGEADSRQYYEPSLTLLDDDRILCVIRNEDAGNMYQTVSTDGGLTWTAPAVAFAGYSPANAIQLSTGTLVSPIRGNAAAKLEAFVATDLGSGTTPPTWVTEGILDNTSYTELEYACPVQLAGPDGRLLVVYSVQPSGATTNADIKTVLVTEGLSTFTAGPTPATTVEDETTFGISPAVGTDLEYARQDHTHGSPADPFSADAVRDAGRWELAVITGSPPDPLYADGDYLYIWVT